MKIRIQAINFDAAEQLEAYIHKKVGKLEKFFDEILSVEVYLKVIKPETAANKEAEIKIAIPNQEFFASKICDTFEEAIDLSVSALEKQIRKHKEKVSKK
jgi:putative sigma-54 modulation protein